MQQGQYDRSWSDGGNRQGSGSGSSTFRPRSPLLAAKEGLDRNRSPGHSNRKDRIESISDEPRRLDRNRLSKSEVVDEDEKEYQTLLSKVKEGQVQTREKERQKHRSREEKSTKSSKKRESSPEDALEQLQKKLDSSAKARNGSDSTRVNGSREAKVSTTWSDPDADRKYGSSNREANGHRHHDDHDYHEGNKDRDSRSRRRDEESKNRREGHLRSHREGSSRSWQDREHEDYVDRYEARRQDEYEYDYRYRRKRDDDEWRYRPSEDRGQSRPNSRSTGYSDDKYRESRSSYDDRGRGSHIQHDSRIDHHDGRRHSRSSYPDSDKHRHDPHKQIRADATSRSRTERAIHTRDEAPQEKMLTKAAEEPPAPPIESRPTTPPPPPVPPELYSFKPVRLPHQLLEPGNEGLIPVQKADGKKLMPFQLSFDHNTKKEPVERPDKVESKCVDPRLKGKVRPVREKVKVLRYKWDINSAKQPSCVILVTGASPLMTKQTLSHHFRSFGKIAEMDQKNDQLGQSLGIFSIRYKQDYIDDRNLKEEVVSNTTNQRGDQVALAAVKGSQGKIIPNEEVAVSLDDNNKTQFEKIFKVEMAKRVALKAKRSDPPAAAAASDAKLSGNASATVVRMPPPGIPTGPRYDGKSTHNNGIQPSASIVAPIIAPRISKGNLAMQQRPHYSYTPVNSHSQAQPRYNSAQLSRPKKDVKTSWSEEELFVDSKLLILRELGESFMRDLKTRTINAFLKDFMKVNSVGGQALRAPVKVVKEDIEGSESEAEIRRPKGRRRRMMEEERERIGATPESTENSEKSPSDIEGDVIAAADFTRGDVEKEGSKKGKKMKKTKMAVDVVDEIEEEDDTTTIPTAIRIKAKKATVKKIREPSPVVDPFASGLAEDEEDLYYLKMTLERIKSGKSLAEVQAEELEAIEIAADLDSGVGVNGLPRHPSGSARTEGVYKIPPAEKAVHIPDRNRAAVDPSNAVGFASARDNRADSRRFVQGIEQHKKETATDTDILKFNQLRSRKKQLKFSKSPIHDWGLYAVELIPAGDMVIEYVGEIVRQQVADQREKMYERQGNFSTYLFRVDDDVVVDATKKGNIARLMNHCCTPNCNAKILTLNGEKRIVLFAQKPILPGQELTYDYKFQATGDEEDAIACLCGSPGCRRFL